MRRTVTIIIILFSLLVAKISFAEVPRVSLLTCTPGNELYSTFGHSALRIVYTESARDLVFNFGLFDFNTPNFYTKFMRGKLKYMLGIQYMNDFIYQYQWEGRGVTEQVLSLDSAATMKLISKLDYLYRPENRYYLYSFLYKNCTSELRDLIFDHSESDSISLKKMSGKTNRDLINEYIDGWTGFGINILLGSTLDKEVDVFQTMFLPDYLYNELSLASNGNKPLVVQENLILESGKRDDISRNLFSPLFVFSLLAAIIGFSLIKRRFRVLDLSFLTFTGLLGLFLGTLILITEHRELYSNFNLLWCNPLYLLLALSSALKWRKSERVLAIASLIALSSMVIIWVSGIQYAEPGYVIIVLILAFSSAYKVR